MDSKSSNAQISGCFGFLFIYDCKLENSLLNSPPADNLVNAASHNKHTLLIFYLPNVFLRVTGLVATWSSCHMSSGTILTNMFATVRHGLLSSNLQYHCLPSDY